MLKTEKIERKDEKGKKRVSEEMRGKFERERELGCRYTGDRETGGWEGAKEPFFSALFLLDCCSWNTFPLQVLSAYYCDKNNILFLLIGGDQK